MMHELDTPEGCRDARERVLRALHDALVDGDKELARGYRTMLSEIAVALEALVPKQREP